MKKAMQIDDFWKKYLDAVLKHSVPRDKAEWYLKWAQKFVVFAFLRDFKTVSRKAAKCARTDDLFFFTPNFFNSYVRISR